MSLRENGAEAGSIPGRLIVPTPIELRIMRLVIDGRSTQEIADELNLSKANVWKHRHKCNERMGTKSFLQTILVCFKKGLIEIGD